MRLQVVGESERTARYVGIKVEKVIVRTMLLSGADLRTGRAASGRRYQPHRDHHHCQDGQGFTAVMVSWMAKFNPFTMVFYQLS